MKLVIIEGDPHHFQFMKKTNQQKPTILVKLVLGTKPDTRLNIKPIKGI